MYWAESLSLYIVSTATALGQLSGKPDDVPQPLSDENDLIRLSSLSFLFTANALQA